MDAILAWMLVGHQVLGYCTAFVTGPGALITWKSRATHRRWGQAFFLSMLVLYVTGAPRSFYYQPFLSWGMFRNFTFNLYGVLLLLLGYRAIRLWVQGRSERSAVDHVLGVTLWLLSLGMLAIGISDLPMLVFGIIGLVFAGIDTWETRRFPLDRQVHFRRHLRYIFGSYYYLLTVISIVHVPAGHDLKWLWPAVLGLSVWAVAHWPSLLQRKNQRSRLLPWSVRAAFIANVGLCLLILCEAAASVWQVTHPVAVPLAAKLERHWQRYEQAQMELVRRIAEGGAMYRPEWESLLQPERGFRLTAAEMRELRKLQRDRIQQRAKQSRDTSLIDLDVVRRSGDVRAFCRSLPKGGMLHVHPNGTLDPTTLENLLRQLDPRIDWSEVRRIRGLAADEISFLKGYAAPTYYGDLAPAHQQKFRELYFLRNGRFDFARFDAVFGLVGLLKSRPGLNTLEIVWQDFFRRAQTERLHYVEFTYGFEPTRDKLDELERLAQIAQENYEITLRINFAFNRTASPSDNQATLEKLLKLLEHHPTNVLVGIDMLGKEAGFPALDAGQLVYGQVLASPTWRRKLHRTMHAGGLGEPRNARDAVLLGAERVGHGNRLLDCPVFLECASRSEVAVEANLVSNVRLGYVADFESHPFLDLLRSGLRVSLSTDDEGILCTDLSHEFTMAVTHTDICYAELKQLAYNSIETAFCTDQDKQRLRTILDEEFSEFESGWSTIVKKR